MPAFAENALLEIIGVAAVFEHDDIVVRLEQQHVRSERCIVRVVRDEAGVGQHGERAVAALDAVADAFLCIVRGAERADLQVLDGEGLVCGKDMQIRRGIADRRGGAKTCVERGRVLFLQRTQGAYMVDVLVRDEDTVQIIEREGKRRERLRDAAAGDARVDQNMGVFVADERCVSGARTGKCVKFHGPIPLYQFVRIIPQPRAIVKRKSPLGEGAGKGGNALSRRGRQAPPRSRFRRCRRGRPQRRRRRRHRDSAGRDAPDRDNSSQHRCSGRAFSRNSA